MMADIAAHMRTVAWTLQNRKDKPWTVATARRTVTAVVDYLRFNDESPAASDELEGAVAFLIQDAHDKGVASAVAERVTK